jgi:hypothetical protein
MVVMRHAIQLMLSMLLLFKLERRQDWSLFFFFLELLPRPLPGKEEGDEEKVGWYRAVLADIWRSSASVASFFFLLHVMATT